MNDRCPFVRPGQLSPRRPAPPPFQQRRKRALPPPSWDTILNPVTVCIAAYARNAKAIVVVSDTLLSNDYAAYDGAVKCEPLHIQSSSWFALYAGFQAEYDALRPRIQAALALLQRPQFADVLAATTAAYASELVAIGDTDYLAPLGLSRAEFLKNGLRYFGDVEFARVLKRLSKVRLGTSLLVFGFDDDGGHIVEVTGTGRVYRRDNNPAFFAIGTGAFSALGLLNLDPAFILAPTVEPIIYKLCAAKFAAQAAVRSVGEKTMAIVCGQRAGHSPIEFLFDSHLRSLRDMWLAQTIICPPGATDHIKSMINESNLQARQFGELIVARARAAELIRGE